MDTNLVIFLYSSTEVRKKESVENLIQENEVWISTQVLNEFANVMFKKFALDWALIRQAIQELEQNLNLYYNTDKTILKACEIAERYQFSFYDSQIISAALACNCATLYTEDLNHSQIIESSLTIWNPFKV